MTSPRMETCATHGLRYDASQHDNCVLCRRLIAQPEQARAPAGLPKLLVMIGLGVCALAAALFVVRGGLHREQQSGVPAAAESCVSPLVANLERCMSGCGSRGTYCRGDCLADLNDGLGACSGLPLLDSTGMQIVSSAGDHPDWSLVQYKLQPALQALSSCGENRGTFTARVAVRPDKKVSEVAVGSRQRDVAECIAEQLKSFDSPALPGSDYSFVVRAQPPAGKPMAPPEPAANTPQFTPMPRKSNPEEIVLVSNDQGSNIELLQSALKLARSQCMPEPKQECAAAVSKLRFHFASLKPGAYGEARLERFAANVFGAGFDCVNIDTQKSFRHNTAIALARPTELRSAKWVLVSSSPLDKFPNLETADERRFPGLRTEFVHLNDLKTRELSLCVSVPDDEHGEWRLGVATYERPSEGEQQYNWHRTDITAFGVGLGTADYQKLQSAIAERDYETTKRLLVVEHVPLMRVRAPLVLAIRSYWDPDKLEILFRAGARPNDIDNDGLSAMHAAALTGPDEKFAALLKVLQRNGGNVNLIADGRAPLHILAVMQGRDRSWDAAVAAGADPNLKNDRGETAEDLRCFCQ